jgi:transcriptional regulator with XRE-family HTH domain
MKRKVSEAARHLKEMRVKAGLSIGALAKELGREKSSYAHYERRYTKRFLPQDLVEQLAPIFERFGIPRDETLALGGLVAVETAQRMAATGAAVNTGNPLPDDGAAGNEQVRTGGDPGGPKEDRQMTPEETRIIQVYRSLPSIDKGAFEMMAEGFASRAGPREEPARRPPITAGKTGT